MNVTRLTSSFCSDWRDISIHNHTQFLNAFTPKSLWILRSSSCILTISIITSGFEIEENRFILLCLTRLGLIHFNYILFFFNLAFDII